jgi:hypothetical protein
MRQQRQSTISRSEMTALARSQVEPGDELDLGHPARNADAGSVGHGTAGRIGDVTDVASTGGYDFNSPISGSNLTNCQCRAGGKNGSTDDESAFDTTEN